MSALRVRQLGLLPYQPAWQAMQRFTNERGPDTPDEIWLLEHEPVFTQGQAGKAEHLLMPGDIPVVQVDRGGQVTYHGPGQLVAYLLLDVRRSGLGVRELVSRIERSLIGLLAEYGVEAYAKADAPGVYVGQAKIASLGLRIRNGRSFHGLALNVDMDLAPFRRINPCGYAGLAMTQLRDLAGPIDFAEVRAALVRQLVGQLGYAEHETLTGGVEPT
jgi:lipoyl(octanoyl) transferase